MFLLIIGVSHWFPMLTDNYPIFVAEDYVIFGCYYNRTKTPVLIVVIGIRCGRFDIVIGELKQLYIPRFCVDNPLGMIGGKNEDIKQAK